MHQEKKKRFVIDTTSIISYFDNVFSQGSQISPAALDVIRRAFNYPEEIVLVIPSIVFVEIFDKWFRGDGIKQEEFRAKFLAEVFEPIRNAANIEIRGIDIEVMEKFLELHDDNVSLENHDRIVLASAAVLEAVLVTSDSNLRKFVNKRRVIPYILT
jgi:predicted nucleic acid-binding protein